MFRDESLNKDHMFLRRVRSVITHALGMALACAPIFAHAADKITLPQAMLQSPKQSAPYLYFRLTPASTAGQTNVSLFQSALPSAEVDVRIPAHPGDDRVAGRRVSGALSSGTATWSLSPTGRGGTLSVASHVASVNTTLFGVPTTGTTAALALGSAYGFDVALGYKGFGLQAGYSRLAQATHGLAQGADLSLTFAAQNWRTALSVGEQKLAADNLLALAAIDPAKTYSLELGGAYQLSKALSLTGGLRYSIGQMLEPSVDATDVTDTRKTAAIYLGTAIKF